MTVVVTEQPKVTVTVSKKGDTGIPIAEGTKSSAVDAGTFGEIYADNDYIYVCVLTGTAGNAIWKRTVLFTT